ncbi:hypothetical protein HDU79_010951 [Rhizoclosmatium sp. JEL0117]|nr:hypothetical protein HDU79_010951 [Rhizoclosmatium sp. JEL0117]
MLSIPFLAFIILPFLHLSMALPLHIQTQHRRDSTSSTTQIAFGSLVLVCIVCAIGYVSITFARSRSQQSDKQDDQEQLVETRKKDEGAFPGGYIPI